MATVDIRGATVDATDAPSSSTPNAGLGIKTAVRVATTGTNITLSGLQTLDGVALNAGDRVLVKDQADQTTNGIYNASTGNWALSSDFQNNSQLAQGCLVAVAAGVANINTIWELTTANPITLGTSAITFVQPYLVSLQQAGAAALNGTGLTYINSFYPSGVAPPIANNPGTRKLSSFFATLAAAQAALPYLNFTTYSVALTDEIDWCVWQSAADSIFSLPDLNGTSKFPAATFIASGRYTVNRTIVLRGSAIRVIGSVAPFENANNAEYSTRINFNGPNGTLAAQSSIFVFDCSGVTLSEGTCRFEGLAFSCLNGTTTAGEFTLWSQATFVNAITLGTPHTADTIGNFFCEVSHCLFATGIWDGIKAIVPQEFCKVSRCIFYGVQRDGIAWLEVLNDYHTTLIEEDNEYGLVGRYNVLAFSGIESACRFQGSYIESTYNSYWVQNPQFWVQGVVSGVCLVNVSQSSVNMNFEGVSDFQAGFWADIHMVSCADLSIKDFNGRNLMCAAFSGTRMTAAATAFLNANGFLDVTDQQNFNAPTSGSNSNPCGPIKLRSAYDSSINSIFLLGGIFSLGGATTPNYIENCGLHWYIVPTAAGTYATLVQPRSTAQVSLCEPTGVTYVNCPYVVSSNGAFSYWHGQIDANSARGGHLVTIPGPTEYPQWAADTAYLASSYNPAGATYQPFVCPLTENGKIFQCTTSGTSGGSEPAWDTTIGHTTADGGAVWTCVAPCFLTSDVGSPYREEMWLNGVRQFSQIAVPTTGVYSDGDRVRFRAPQPGGYGGAVYSSAAGGWIADAPCGPSLAYNTNAATTSATLTAANISGGYAEVDLALTGTLGAGANATLPTVAALVAQLVNVVPGQTYKLRIVNGSSANFAWTVVTNTGWGTLNGTMTIAQNTWRDFIVKFTSLTAATLQSVGTGSNS